ncbi:MAG: PKD domain-containing protein, partial [Methanosarcina flavescens]
LYSVRLTASNEKGSNTLTKSRYIAVSSVLDIPVTRFSASTTSGKAPLTVSFTDQSKGSPTSWRWAFGDGNTSTERNPVYTYNKPGLYNVTLTTSNANGSNTSTKAGYIAVSNVLTTPVANFSASPASGKIPLTVSFTDQSTGEPTSWRWALGDGNNSTEKNPVHTYNKSGLYSVRLTASNANGSNRLTKSGYVNVSSENGTLMLNHGYTVPVTAFSASPTEGSMPLTVRFTDQSTGSPTSWRWAFGDGNSSTEKNPVHTYDKSGRYSVTLTASNANGSNALTRTGYIAVSNTLAAPVTSFSASTTSGKAPLTVRFTDQSTGEPTSWRWTFGDGNNSTERNPLYIYSKPGLYSVSLTTGNANGSNVLTKSRYVAVSGVLDIPVTSFSASPVSGKAPLTVSFTDQSTGSPTSWRWTFGDGNSSTERNPVHTYNKSGLYNVTLRTSNENGTNVLTKSGYIAVSNSLVAAFSAYPTSGPAPLSVSFTDQSTGSPASWRWAFGDGNTSTDKNPVYTYSKSGNYTVSLTINNSGNISTETRSRYIAVSK